MVGALLRLTEIEAGQILIDSIDVRTVRLARLRSAVGFVPQSTFLFEACLCPHALFCFIRSLCSSALSLPIQPADLPWTGFQRSVRRI